MTHPSDMAVLVERLRIMAKQKLAAEMEDHEIDCADWQAGYEWLVGEAREVLQALSTDQRTGQGVAGEVDVPLAFYAWLAGIERDVRAHELAPHEIAALIEALTKAAPPVEADLREVLTNAVYALEYWERESRVWLSARAENAKPGWMRGTRERGQYEIARGKEALQQSRSTPGAAPREVTDAEVRAHHRYRTLHEDFVTVETDLRNCAILIGHHYNSLRPVADKLKEVLAASPVPAGVDFVVVRVDDLARIRASMCLLQQNAEGCAVNHHGEDFDEHGLAGWLADTKRHCAELTSIIAASEKGHD